MCQGISGCQHPERLKGEPKDCSKEQITECHPEAKAGEHPCTPKEKE